MIVTHVIDRDAAIRLAVRRALKPAGFTVTEAESAAAPAPCQPDLVIAEIAAVSVAMLGQRYPTASILPLIGHAAPPRPGLRKPFTPSQLLAAVRQCLARHAATTGPRRRSPSPRSRPT
jgi:DNA-binding response OmpR family regulator